MTKHLTRATLVIAFLASIPFANWMLTHVGEQSFPGGPHTLPVWPVIDAPSGVYIVGITLVLRDLVQRRNGKPATVALILAGALLSWWVSPALAVASGVAFLVSESIDFAVFCAFEKRGLVVAVAASNAVSLIVDSLVFLWLAFGSLAFVEGQLIGKAWATVAALAVLVALNRRRSPAVA